MIPPVEEKIGKLQQLCDHYRVLRLDLFGSAATGNYRGNESDLDFLVEFQTLSTGQIRQCLLRIARRSGIALWASCGPHRRFGH